MHDFIAIGDTVVEPFIKIAKADIVGTPSTPDYKICLPFAEKIPYEESIFMPAAGNAANASVAAARLGLASALVSNIGDDEHGKECLAALEASGVDPRYVKVHKDAKTNYHYVLWYPPDRTILTKHESFEYSMPDIGSPKWMYFSSVAASAFPFHEFVADYLETHKSIRLAFQPGKNEIKLGKEKLSRLYKRADIFFCNVEEAGVILGLETLGISELLRRMHELGPKIVVITDGPNGAYAYDGENIWFVPVYPDGLIPKERTGAGDSFAATVTSALFLGKDLPTALLWGAVNSASVVQEVGAQKGLLSRDVIEERLAIAQDFKAQLL